MVKNKELIEKKIKKIEDRIKEASQHTHFGDPVFSEWYQDRVEEIEKLQHELDN